MDLVQTQVDDLLPLKNKIDELLKRVKEIKRAITEVHNSDEDMKMILFNTPSISDDGSKPYTCRVNASSVMIIDTSSQSEAVNVEKSFSSLMYVETLFETYLNEIEWISAEIEEMLDEIINTEEFIVLQLDILRNRILRFELNLSILSFVGTCGAFVTGLFGMNLLSHFETNKFSFYYVSLVAMFGCSLLFFSLKQFAQREKLF
jgi:Mg2+ and Co2+ transporter CorA